MLCSCLFELSINKNYHYYYYYTSFIHSGYFYSASLSPLLFKVAPDTAWILCRNFTSNFHRKQWVKDLPKVPTWRLQRELNPWPSGQKTLPMRHHAPTNYYYYYYYYSPHGLHLMSTVMLAGSEFERFWHSQRNLSDWIKQLTITHWNTRTKQSNAQSKPKKFRRLFQSIKFLIYAFHPSNSHSAQKSCQRAEDILKIMKRYLVKPNTFRTLESTTILYLSKSSSATVITSNWF